MASDASRQDTADTRSCQAIPQANYQQQHQYLSSNSFDKHGSLRTFIQLDQQQQQQLYEGHQEHKAFIQNPCYCYQNGSNQVCSRCQTHEEQNNSGAFIYQPIEADDALSGPIQGPQVQTNGNDQLSRRHQSSAGYSSSPSSSSSSTSISFGNKHHDSSFQEPVYGSNIKYYLEQPQQPKHQSGFNNNNNNLAFSETNDLMISDGVGRQMALDFHNSDSSSNNNNNNNNHITRNNEDNPMLENNEGLYYQCSNEDAGQFVGRHQANDDWKSRSLLVEVPSDKLFNCNLDVNNNNQHDLQGNQQFSTPYPMIQLAQDVKKLPCQQVYDRQFNNDNFTSIQQQHYDSYQREPDEREPISFESPFNVTPHSQQVAQSMGAISNCNPLPVEHQQQEIHIQSNQLPVESCQPYATNSESLAQSCFRSSEDGSPCQQLSAIDRQLKSPAGKAHRKSPASLNKANGKLWEFIRDLLLSDRTNPAFIRWERREDGVFKFVQSNKVAKMWGERKQNPKMTYEKLSRAMRYYYKSKVLLPVFGRRLVYKFGPNASGWNKTE